MLSHGAVNISQSPLNMHHKDWRFTTHS